MPNHPPSYVKEMLFSQWNINIGLSALALGTVLSIPYGFGIGLLPLIAFAAGDAIAAMFIPYSEGFRSRVDKRLRRRAREAQRQHLLDEIEKREASAKGLGSMRAYMRMMERVQSLYKVAADSRTLLTERDVEKLDDATLDYLSMWLAAQVIDERSRAVNLRDIETRLKIIEDDLQDNRPGTDLNQLQKARTEYLALITRHRRMLSRKMAIEAAIVSMPDQMDEIYQTIVTAPATADMGSKLAESISKLSLEEDLETELEGIMRETVPDYSSRREQREADKDSNARAATRQAQGQRQ